MLISLPSHQAPIQLGSLGLSVVVSLRLTYNRIQMAAKPYPKTGPINRRLDMSPIEKHRGLFKKESHSN